MQLNDKRAICAFTVSIFDTMMFQHALLNELIAFIAVAEYGSFTQAAESLHTTKSSTGKAIQKLEAALGIKLFNRSTRSVRLTEEGHIYLDAAKNAVDTINEAKQLLDARKAEPAGRLRVNLPIGIGKAVVLALSTFTQAYPKVSVELSLSDRFEEAIEGNWDIVVRIGELEDSGLIARKLCDLRSVLVASPKYLARKGTPQTLSELRAHEAVLFRAPGGKLRPWMFVEKRNQMIEMSPSPVAVFSDGRTLVDAVVSGQGVAQIYDKAFGDSLENGELVELFPHLAPAGPPVNAMITIGRVMPAKTRAFLVFLTDLFAG